MKAVDTSQFYSSSKEVLCSVLSLKYWSLIPEGHTHGQDQDMSTESGTGKNMQPPPKSDDSHTAYVLLTSKKEVL